MLFRSRGVASYLVDIGGEIRVAGQSARGDNWRLAIERPDGSFNMVYQPVSIRDAAIATSGEYRNFYMLDGRRISHTLDPRTGYPIDHSGYSVSVVASGAALADAWATALNVLGPDDGYQLAAEHGIAAFFIYDVDGELSHRFTEAFRRYLD